MLSRSTMLRALLGIPLAIAVTPWAANAEMTGDELDTSFVRKKLDRQRSTSSTLLELRFGAYYPQIDQQFATQPFRRSFGSESALALGIEYDRTLCRIPHFGTWAVAFGVAYTSFESATESSSTKPAEPALGLHILPIYGALAVRADRIARELRVPLVPYTKLGIGEAVWWASGMADTAAERALAGRGSSFGLHAALGLSLLLDVLDASDGRELHNATGINHSYFFVEGHASNYGMFSHEQLRLGTRALTAGLALEF